MDSRLRGNDKLMRGNDKLMRGNDKTVRGNDKKENPAINGGAKPFDRLRAGNPP